MYNKKKMQFHHNPTVGELIRALKKCPQNATVLVCGDTYCYIQVETKNTVVCIDNEDLEECYVDAR